MFPKLIFVLWKKIFYKEKVNFTSHKGATSDYPSIPPPQPIHTLTQNVSYSTEKREIVSLCSKFEVSNTETRHTY